ncbi:hypothetical protein TURU_155172 [Turdus rufiventris]|nr:hypothetical protein TURU_155172 [Turdus rufiventris]
MLKEEWKNWATGIVDAPETGSILSGHQRVCGGTEGAQKQSQLLGRVLQLGKQNLFAHLALGFMTSEEDVQSSSEQISAGRNRKMENPWCYIVSE